MSVISRSTVACLVVCAALAGCGQDNSTSGTAPARSTSSAPAPGAPVVSEADEQARRDVYLHSTQTLDFLGVSPDKQVLDVEPQSPWLVRAVGGKPNYAAVVPMAASDFLAANKNVAGWTTSNVRSFSPVDPVLGEPGSVDVVMTVDNVANWFRDKRIEGMFKAMHAVLKPGGTLGVVAPRAAAPVADGDTSGYLAEKQVVFYAELAGFQLAQWSEMNANKKDTRDYPNGAASLPPILKGGETDRARFEAIGEPDRMTLKFIKKAD